MKIELSLKSNLTFESEATEFVYEDEKFIVLADVNVPFSCHSEQRKYLKEWL